MATRQFNEQRLSVVKRPVDLYAVVSVGAAGAVTMQKWNYPTFGTGANARTYTASATSGGGAGGFGYTAGFEGVKSVARTAAGLWTVTFQDNYQRLLKMSGFSSLAGGLSAIVGVSENTTITSLSASGGSVIGVTLLSATATALDPASGEVMKLSFTLQDATEP